MKYTAFEVILIVIVSTLFAVFIGIVTKNDTKLNDTWDKCQTQFEQSGAPMEVRDSMMRDCFSK